jgi:hypothetical protein
MQWVVWRVVRRAGERFHARRVRYRGAR